MNRLYNPLAPKPNRAHAHSAQIKAWVREALALPDDTPISVTELACRDEGCPDIETVIGVFEPGKKIRTLRVHVPIAEVHQENIAQVCIAAA